jgi:hypothetical protein
VFGSLLVRELAPRYEVVEGTRDRLDFRGAFAVCCAAGPFQRLDRRMAFDAVSAGAHWLDIADDAGWFFDLLDDRALDALARERRVAVIPGLSSLPAISGALTRTLMPVEDVEITLFIGNGNRKGAAAMASAAELDPPDRELLRRELGIEASVRVAFELPLAALMLRLLGKVPPAPRLRLAKILSRIPLRLGTPGGAVEVRAGERVARAAGKDQRFAILPVVFALEHLDGLRGCLSPSAFDATELLRCLE